VRVKICGITRAHDAEVAAAAGADAIGLVFWSRSRRALDVAQARAIVAVLPPFVASVALFVDPETELVQRVCDALRPDLLQFHGNETDEFCGRFGVPYIKAVKIGGVSPPMGELGAHPGARGLLFDTQDATLPGGSGRVFDWGLLPALPGRSLILAGGLHAGNVVAAMRAVRPWAVDVSSGVEQAPGIKDPQRVADFMRAVAAENAMAQD
jgi:phosphoribosylanthranilate isomerase